MQGKEKILERQRRLTDQKDLLKDKIKFINENARKSLTTSKFKDDVKLNDSVPKSLNPKKPLPSVISHHGGNFPSTSGTQAQHKLMTNTSEYRSSDQSTVDVRTGNLGLRSSMNSARLQYSSESSDTSPQRSPILSPRKSSPPVLSKYKKLGNIDSKKSNVDATTSPRKNKRFIKKAPKSSVEEQKNKYFDKASVEDSNRQGDDNASFTLPEKEYRDLMYSKLNVDKHLKPHYVPLEDSEKEFKPPTTAAQGHTSKPPNTNNTTRRCFSQITQSLEVDRKDGQITICHLENKYLVIVQVAKINAYCMKDKKPNEWLLKESLKRIQHDNIIKEVVMTNLIDGKETIVFCEVFLIKDARVDKCYLKMAQYQLLNENGSTFKEYLFGSFDCDLENFTSIIIKRRPCTIAVSAWAKIQRKSVAWIFILNNLLDIFKCTPMIPVKHEICSLHDLSVTNSKIMLLGFGTKSFTVWNGKTGERFIFVNLARIGPVKSMTCLFGVFAIIQKGFLFLVLSIKDRLHMVAVNMATGLFKSLRQFRLPIEHKCHTAFVKDDFLVAITDKSILSWSMYDMERLQQLKMEEADRSFVIKNRIIITTANKFKRILIVKDIDEVKQPEPNQSAGNSARKEPVNIDTTSSAGSESAIGADET